MGVIRRLSPTLVNRIAAGECVERPSSVVKELVENALDAGARRIDVLVEDGGRGLIRVSDDGVGMEPDDLPLAVAPHATSKIHHDDDLFNIHTMGFRGEALASIASVARLRIRSRRADRDEAYGLSVDGGVVSGPEATAAPPGTTVEVSDLFYCVPARRRFLRTNQTEMGHISEQLARIALAHTGVAFTLSHGKRVLHHLTAAPDRRTRIEALFGRELAEGLIPVEREGGGVRVEGLVARPAEARPSSKWEYVFVNGRFIRDRFVTHAVREAYRSLIDPARFPVAFLYITVNPDQVDVNVHPTKIEVRWRDSNYVHGQVLAALRDKFLATNLDRSLRPPSDAAEHREHVRRAMVEFFTGRSAAPAGAAFGADAGLDVRVPARGAAGPFAPAAMGGDAPRAHDADDSPRDDAARRALDEYVARPAPPALTAGAGPDGAPAWPRRGALQVHGTYLVVETDDGLMIIDQHALHERILYEQFQRRITDRPLESQRLLIPLPVRVPPDRLEAVEVHAATLARLGIELAATGPQTLSILAFPTFLERVEPTGFVRDLLDLLAETSGAPQSDTLLHRILDMMACKAAVKAGDALTDAEIEALLAQRAAAERASNCPHGRPTTLRLTLRDLERQFKRR